MPGAETYIQSEHVDVRKSGTELRALEEALMHRLPAFYRTAYRFLGNPADAEDAVQEGVLSAYQHIRDFRGESQISTWLTAIVSNCARMQLRKRRHRVHVSLEERTSEDQEYSLLEGLPDKRASPENDCLENERKAQLRTFAAQLSPALRRTFQLRALEGLSIRETADTLGMPEGTVKAQLSRARRKLTHSMRKGLGM
jgi:RNA polymerase sigma-70 factor, ECF subfamily